MILLLGSAAYSPFRMDALKDAIAKLDPSLGSLAIDARWVYAVELTSAAFDAEELKRAAILLNAEGNCDGADFFVTPRKGTISPWSSKATDIFRNCGLKSILRVERGIRFKVNYLAPKPWKTPKDLRESAAIAALYDKMTEGVYTDLSDAQVAHMMCLVRAWKRFARRMRNWDSRFPSLRWRISRRVLPRRGAIRQIRNL